MKRVGYREEGFDLTRLAEPRGLRGSSVSRRDHPDPNTKQPRTHLGYRATTAQALAYERASRPKPAKLVTNLAPRAAVEQDLEKKYSPEQITGRLLVEIFDDPEMRVTEWHDRVRVRGGRTGGSTYSGLLPRSAMLSCASVRGLSGLPNRLQRGVSVHLGGFLRSGRRAGTGFGG